jgi:hypothetical protein
MFTDFNDCMKWPEPYEGFRFSGKSTQYLMKKTSQGMDRGTNGTLYRSQKNARFVNLGKHIQMWRFAVARSQLILWTSRKSSFVF